MALAVPPVRSTSAASMQSPPASADHHQGQHLVARIRPPRRISEVNVAVSTSSRRPRCWARVTGRSSPALATRRWSSKVTWIRSGSLQVVAFIWVLLVSGRFCCFRNHYPRSTGALSYPFSTPTQSYLRWIGGQTEESTLLGRFLAYKAMNSVWRSATRRSGLGGASAASPAETAKLALAIMSYAGIFFGGMASCMAGGAVTLSLGLALVWIIGPAVFIAVLNLPGRWVEAKRPLPEGSGGDAGQEGLPHRWSGSPVVMLLGIGTCFGGQPTLGTIIALGGSCLLFVALVFAPVKWLGYRKVDVTQNGRDKTTAVDAHRDESQLRRNHPRVSSVCSVVSGLGPSIHVRCVCPVCRKESLTAESISGIGWPRLTCECGAPYGALVKTTFVGETWARYLLSDGQPSRC